MDNSCAQHPATHKTGHHFGLVFIALCVVFFTTAFAGPAHAGGQFNVQDPNYEFGVGYDEESGAISNTATTSGVGDLEMDGDYTCNDDGSTSGYLFINPQCDASRGLFGVFANVVCRIENLFATMLGLVYCAVKSALLEPLLALFALYVTVYGAMVILGMVPHTFGEAITRVLKIGAVAALALNADIAIGVGYTFFISLLQATVGIVFDLFTPDYISEHQSMQDMIQAGYISSPTNPDESLRLYTGSNWMQNLDYTTHRVIGFFVSGGKGFAIVMIALFFLMPPLFLLIIYLMISILQTFATAIVGYLMALLGITFLFTVAPIFVSFALFRTTAGWFDTWLKHLLSYTLQIMVIFVFLMFMVMVDIVSFFQQVGGMVRNYPHTSAFGRIIVPIPNVYTLCRPERDGPNGRTGELVYYKFTVDGVPGGEIGNQYEGFPRCIPELDLREILTAAANGSSLNANQLPPGMTPDQVQKLIDAIDGVKAGDIDVPNLGDDLPSGLDAIEQILIKENEKLKLPFFELLTTTDLIFFLLVRFLCIIALTYLLERFMRKVPHMASQLSGTGFAGRLGAGEQEPGDAPGVQNPGDFAGLQTGFAKFKKTAFGDGYYQRGGLRSAPSRFARGIAAGLGASGQSMMRQSLIRGGNLGMSGDVRRELLEDQSILESKREGLFAPSGRSGIGRPDGIHHPGGRGGRELPKTSQAQRRSRHGH